MLKKLLKYEFHAVLRTLFPIALGALALSGLTALTGALAVNVPALQGALPYTVFCAVLEVFTFILLFALLAACAFTLIARFYKLLGEQGYLMLALPVSPSQHIAAKLICAVATTVLSVVWVILCGTLIAVGLGEVSVELMSFAIEPLYVVIGAVVLLLLLAAGYLFLYLCIAVGGHWPQQRLLASVAAYFVLSFIGQALGILLLLIGAAVSQVVAFPAVSAGNEAAVVSGFGFAFLLLCFFVDVLLWAAIRYLMTKRLNLP